MTKRTKNKTVPSRWLFLMPVCVAFFIFGTIVAYAAMVSEDKKENNFQIGNLETKIKEVFTKPTNSLEPGDSYSKNVRIQNDGTINQFVRVMVFPEVTAETIGATEKRILPVEIGKDILLDIDPEKTSSANWKDGGDGYYYYVKALAPAKETKLLFSTVELPASLDTSYDGGEFVIQLKVESVICATNAYRDAWWQGQQPTTGLLKDIDTLLQAEVD